MPGLTTSAMNTKTDGRKSDDESTSSHAGRIRIKNRRKRYLDLHPEYFTSASVELQDPLLHDRLVRRFQSAKEREDQGRQRGYAGVLEADLVRSEAKLEALKHPDPNSPLVYSRAADGSIAAVEQDEGERATDREGGFEQWKDVMGQRFMRGDDRDFDYAAVDENEEYDDRVEEERRVQDDYFDQEEVTNVDRPQGETGIQDY